MDDSEFRRLGQRLFLTIPLLHDRLIKPFESRFRRGFSQDLSQGFSPGFSPMQFYTLVLLHSRSSMTMTELAAYFCIPKQQMTKIVNRLVDLDLARRTGDPEDRRLIRMTLTDQGAEALSDCRDMLEQHIRVWAGTLEPSEQQELSQSVQTLHRLLSKLPAPGE